MTALPQEIKERFYKTINSDVSLGEFEQWLYQDKELESLLGADDYIELISLDFRKNSNKYELWNLLKKHIDIAEFKKYKVLGLLKDAQLNNAKLPYILMEFYDLYCKGYGFLQNLALCYGLELETANLEGATVDSWDELTTDQQMRLLNNLIPGLEEEIQRVILWIEEGQIIFNGKDEEESDNCIYNDLRPEEECNPISDTTEILVQTGDSEGFKNFEVIFLSLVCIAVAIRWGTLYGLGLFLSIYPLLRRL